jgi:hypothetical protein
MVLLNLHCHGTETFFARFFAEKLVPQSQLMSMEAIGLRRPFAKMKVAESCTCVMFIDSVDGC